MEQATFDIRKLRRELGMNQREFWSEIGVTQSGGSRYESGRNIPKPVKELLRLVYCEKIDLASINKIDLIVAELLKERDAELYHTLKEMAEYYTE